MKRFVGHFNPTWTKHLIPEYPVYYQKISQADNMIC